jgi:hypothetical protein
MNATHKVPQLPDSSSWGVTGTGTATTLAERSVSVSFELVVARHNELISGNDDVEPTVVATTVG